MSLVTVPLTCRPLISLARLFLCLRDVKPSELWEKRTKLTENLTRCPVWNVGTSSSILENHFVNPNARGGPEPQPEQCKWV